MSVVSDPNDRKRDDGEDGTVVMVGPVERSFLRVSVCVCFCFCALVRLCDSLSFRMLLPMSLTPAFGCCVTGISSFRNPKQTKEGRSRPKMGSGRTTQETKENWIHNFLLETTMDANISPYLLTVFVSTGFIFLIIFTCFCSRRYVSCTPRKISARLRNDVDQSSSRDHTVAHDGHGLNENEHDEETGPSGRMSNRGQQEQVQDRDAFIPLMFDCSLLCDDLSKLPTRTVSALWECVRCGATMSSEARRQEERRLTEARRALERRRRAIAEMLTLVPPEAVLENGGDGRSGTSREADFERLQRQQIEANLEGLNAQGGDYPSNRTTQRNVRREQHLQRVLRFVQIRTSNKHNRKNGPSKSEQDYRNSQRDRESTRDAVSASGKSNRSLLGRSLDCREDSESICPICLEAFEDGELVNERSVCLHMFHKECLLGWLQNHDVCPCCRIELVADGPGTP